MKTSIEGSPGASSLARLAGVRRRAFAAGMLLLVAGWASSLHAQPAARQQVWRKVSYSQAAAERSSAPNDLSVDGVDTPCSPETDPTVPATRESRPKLEIGNKNGSLYLRMSDGPRSRLMRCAAVEQESLPAPKLEATLPLAGGGPGDVKLEAKNGLIDLTVRDAPLSRVLSMLAQTQQLNIVASNDIDALISITLRRVPLEDALTAILSVANYTWVKRNNIILITSLSEGDTLPADVQGRQIQVFELDFAKASDVEQAITTTGFLSPIGKVSVSKASSADNRATRERVVVEDLPDSLARIAEFVCQIDQPPRQVLIEAHILQVNLDDTTKCGVNLDQLVRISHSDLLIKTTGFANKNAPQAFLATLEGGDLGGVVELIQSTTDSKTLGSPKLLVLNEQEAEFQVGEKLGYKTTLTTETNTQETVQFLNVGVVLGVTPRITRDGRVLMHVAPKVSTGDVVNDLPNEKTTELHTDVILHDGQGMIIGGLIKEEDTVTQQKVPYLGDVKGVGFFFRRSERTKERVEIIIALVPRIQPYDAQWQAYEQGEVVRATVPLWHGPLCRTDRPWDPVLPDGKRVTKPLVPKKHGAPSGHFHNLGPQYEIPPYPLPEQHIGEQYCAPADSRLMNARSKGSAPTVESLPAPGEFWDGAEVISD
jgi:type IV pilus assembly protein PilQ